MSRERVRCRQLRGATSPDQAAAAPRAADKAFEKEQPGESVQVDVGILDTEILANAPLILC